MRIGLVRHFKVNCPHKKMMTSAEFREWSEKYEVSKVFIKPVKMNGVKWDICYVSNMPRAITTAKEVYTGNIIIDKLLREVDNMPFIHTEKIRLPFEVWHICGRLAWYFKSNSQPETIRDTRRRIKKFMNKMDWSKENVLIVCHGWMIFNIQHELRKRGFRGKRITHVKNGFLYEFIRDDDGLKE